MTDVALMHWIILILVALLFLERFGLHVYKIVTPLFTAYLNGKEKNKEVEDGRS